VRLCEVTQLFYYVSEYRAVWTIITFDTVSGSRQRLKCDGTRSETQFCLSAKRMSPFKPAGASFQSTTGSRGVRISCSNGSNAGYSMFRGSVKSTGYPLHSPVSPSLLLPYVTVWHHISTGLYQRCTCMVCKLAYNSRLKYGVQVKTSIQAICLTKYCYSDRCCQSRRRWMSLRGLVIWHSDPLCRPIYMWVCCAQTFYAQG